MLHYVAFILAINSTAMTQLELCNRQFGGEGRNISHLIAVKLESVGDWILGNEIKVQTCVLPVAWPEHFKFPRVQRSNVHREAHILSRYINKDSENIGHSEACVSNVYIHLLQTSPTYRKICVISAFNTINAIRSQKYFKFILCPEHMYTEWCVLQNAKSIFFKLWLIATGGISSMARLMFLVQGIYKSAFIHGETNGNVKIKFVTFWSRGIIDAWKLLCFWRRLVCDTLRCYLVNIFSIQGIKFDIY